MSSEECYKCYKCNRTCDISASDADFFGYTCDACKKIVCTDCNTGGQQAREAGYIPGKSTAMVFLCPDCIETVKEIPKIGNKLAASRHDIAVIKVATKSLEEQGRTDAQEIIKLKQEIATLKFMVRELMTPKPDGSLMATDHEELSQVLRDLLRQELRKTVEELKAEYLDQTNRIITSLQKSSEISNAEGASSGSTKSISMTESTEAVNPEQNYKSTTMPLNMIDAFLGKQYKLFYSSDNFEDFLKELGVGLVTRKVGNAVSPVVELNKDGEEYILTSNSTFKNVVTKFKPGEEFDQDTPDGRKVKATISLEGNTLKEVQKGADGKITTIDRTWTDDEIKMVMSIGDITATRIYKLQG